MGTVLLVATITAGGCGYGESPAEKHREANTPAGKLGQVAHKAAVEADKAGRVIGRKLDKAAHDAKEGWNEDAHKPQERR